MRESVDGQPDTAPASIPEQGVTSRRASVRDLTPAAGRDELQLLRAAVEGGLEGLVVVSPEGVLITYNRMFQEIWPIPADVVRGGSDEAALASVLDKLVDPAAFLARVHSLYERASGTARDELLLRDGRVLDRFGTALQDEDGGYIGWAWYFRDVTAERAAAADAERLGALVAVAQALGDAQTDVEVLSVVSGLGARVLGASGAILCLVEPDGRYVRTLATTFFDEGVRAEVAQLEVDFPLPLVHVAVTGSPLFLTDREDAVRLFPLSEALYERARTRGSAAVPLAARGKVIGSLSAAFETPKPWRPADRELLLALASLTAQALDRLRAQQAEQVAVEQIRRLSETLQRSLLTEPLQTDAMTIAVRYQPAAQEAQVGGDWYDAFATSDGSMTLVVGDVAGHDRHAAAAMAQVRNVLRGIGQCVEGSPSAVLSALDTALSRLQVSAMATAVLCQTRSDPDSSTAGPSALRWSNAGHPPPLLLQPDGSATLLGREPELLLGMAPGGPRSDHEVALVPGSTVVLYTDGLVERRDESLDEGMERLRVTAADLHALPPEEFCDELLARLATDAEDDVALLVMRLPG